MGARDTNEPTPSRERGAAGHAWRSRLREAALTLSYVFGAMLVVTAVLVISLPRGTKPADLYGGWGAARPSGDRGTTAGGGAADGPDATDTTDPVATLVRVVRTVKDRPARAVAWGVARSGMSLSDEHAIQTAPRSAATLAFGDSSTLELGEKSLVVLRRPTQASGSSARPSLVVLGGQVRGRKSASSQALDIVTPSGALELRPAQDGGAEYSLTVSPDRTTTITLLSGAAAVTAPGGERAELHSNETITLRPDAPPGPVARVPDAPRPAGPAAGSVLLYATVPPLVRFTWSPVPSAKSYRFEIARDAAFEEPFHEAVVESASTAHGGLESGCYHWRVRARDGDAESEPGPAARVCVERDAVPPELRVELPTTPVLADHLQLRGSTEPGASVLVGSLRLDVRSAGEFEHTLALRRGPNLVTVEAVDPAGNVTYHSAYVHAKF